MPGSRSITTSSGPGENNSQLGTTTNRLSSTPAASRVDRAPRQHHRRQRAVGAPVDDEVDVHRDQAPVGVDRRPVPRPRRMPFGRRDHVFRAVVDELHGSTRLPREQRRMPGDHGRILLLAAEPATGLHLHDADLLGRQAEERRERVVDVVRALHGSPDRHAALRAGDRQHPVRLDVQLLLRAGHVLALDDDGRRAERLVHVAARDRV